VRWWAGELEFLGRLDHQVKVRGYRIELGEVEAALLAQAGVREAVVMARGEGAERRLVAYVGGDAAAEALRAGVGTRLPGYMVPGVMVVMDALPRTPNGKIDRRALPDAAEAGHEYVAPRTPEEEVLAAVWAEVLGVERVGVHDHFFELGGHSLLVMQVVARVRQSLGVDLPVRTLFESPTLEAAAAALVEIQLAQVSAEDLSGLILEITGLSEDQIAAMLAGTPEQAAATDAV
jgi:aryl carrier-like protein